MLSNLFNGTVCLVNCAHLMRGKPTGPRLQTWRLMSTAAAALTFFTVMVFLGPVYGYGSMFVGGNFWLHLTLPVLSMLSFVLLERDCALPFRRTFRACVPVGIYAVFYLGNILLRGVGDWPNRRDFYGFLLWGWPTGVAIMLGLMLSVWGIAALLWRLNRIGNRQNRQIM